MTGTAAIVTSVRLVWFVVARIPLINRIVLRRAFPISECKNRCLLDVPGDHARFELTASRPSAALTGLAVNFHNHLPFDVEFEVWRVKAVVTSYQLLDAVLNTRCMVPAAGTANVSLPEVTLSDQQADWMRGRNTDCSRTQFELH